MFSQGDCHAMPQINERPYFCREMSLSFEEITKRLSDPDSREWHDCVAWILREAALPDVWRFVSMSEIADHFSSLEPCLGNRASFWGRFVQTWQELKEQETSTDSGLDGPRPPLPLQGC